MQIAFGKGLISLWSLLTLASSDSAMADIVKTATLISAPVLWGDGGFSDKSAAASALEEVWVLREESGEPVPPNATAEPCSYRQAEL